MDGRRIRPRFAISKINRLLVPTFPPDRYWLVIEGTLRLSKLNAPDPDFHILPVREGTPDALLPLPILVIEVSDPTYPRDSGPKLRAYARAGIGDYWVVNLPEQRVEVYRRPENSSGKAADWRYADVAHRGRGEAVSPVARADSSFPVDGMLP